MTEPTLALNAFPAYRNLPLETRAAFLDAIAEEIEAIGDPLLVTAHEETHLPSARLTGERGRTAAQLRMFARVVREGAFLDRVEEEALPDRAPLPRPRLVRENRPLGPVAVFGASNFPLAFSVAGGDTASALAAGCPVVAKAHPAHPETCRLVAGAIHRAATRIGVPEGTFALVEGGSEVGQELAKDPSIAAVGFTGSFRAGHSLWQTANARPRPIPVFAEMGSVNPLIVLPSAQTEAWAEAYAVSLTMGVGQFCTNPGLVLGFGDGFRPWLQSVAEKLSAMPVGHMLTPQIEEAYVEGVQRWSQQAESLTDHRGGAAPSLFVAPKGTPIERLAEETFGPCGVAYACDGLTELEGLLRNFPGQLTGTVLGDPAEPGFAEAKEALAEIVGRVVANGMPTGVEVGEAMHHGGPWPASTDSRFTSVGTAAIRRWLRPVCFQNFP